METVIVDAATRDKFLAAGSRVEVRDETGKVIGRFEKAVDPERMEYLKQLVGPENWPSEEELDRIEREDRRYTPEEVMEHLRRLSK
jgi:hypothetical protein